MGPEDFFKKLQQSIPQLRKDILTDVIKVEANNIIEHNFAQEGFINGGITKWPQRKKADKGAKKALLVKSSILKGEATSGKVRGNNVEYNMKEYGKVHNEGLHAGRGSGFTMPKRQFIGPSKNLDDKVKQKAWILLQNHLNKL